MGDLRDWSPEPNAAAAAEDRTAANGAEYWRRAEEATQGIIAQVQPTVVSEKRRREVVDFVQSILKDYLGCEVRVFPFGSVPLKTYLPDGDIDLTAFGGMNHEEAFANDVFSVLENQEKNNNMEFVVKDVQLIRAEVKLIKCLVQNIVVDISFTQLGGLCTLCFLEEVDRLIGKDHLFKRSIILIKAWCYYESRILGAHHGLISTYALETLVLYIFHLFHCSLNGPLAVLYKFLDYFSNFDWDNYCISLNGPVRISSLPELMAEPPEKVGHDLLLTDDFLKGCVERFSAPCEPSSKTFPQKHLNIVDPLKENNNLGRSVSKGNFFRIRSAFSYGARKLGRIISQPEDNISDEIPKFFANTLDRHGKGQRPDVQDYLPITGYDELRAVPFSLGTELREIYTVCDADSIYSSEISGECRLNCERSPNDVGTNAEVSGTEDIADRLVNKTSKSSMNGNAVSNNRLKGDAQDLATLRLQGFTISNDTPKSSPGSSEANTASPFSKAHHAPHLYFVNSSLANGERNDDHVKQTDENGHPETKPHGQDESQLVNNSKAGSPVGPKPHLSRMSSIAFSAEDFYPSYTGYRMPSVIVGNPECFNTLADLSGDSESHIASLNYGRWFYECASTMPVLAMPHMLPHFHLKKPWEVVRQSCHLKYFSQMNANGVMHRPPFYPMNPPLLPGGPGFGPEEMPTKPRGTGTYFPNVNHYRDRPVTPRGRNQAPLRSPRSNGRFTALPTENGFPDRTSCDAAQPQFPVQTGTGKSGSSDEPYGSPWKKVDSNANGSMHLPEHFVEFGSIVHLPLEPPLLKGSWQANLGSSIIQNSSASPVSPGVEKQKPVLSLDKDRISVQSYRLKDEDDFPPLSV